VTVFTPSVTSTTGTNVAANAAAGTRRLRELAVAGFAVVAAIAVLYAVFVDQGALLAPLLGKASFNGNYVHEFLHDGRHLMAAPCH
jgi:hypothetical protein